MCAIAGEVVVRHPSRVRLDAVGPMVGALRHRGPDQWGYWASPNHSALLVNARLAIVDPDHGRQPLSNEDGTVWVTFNGELYGFDRLAEDLGRRGHRFRTRSDTEVIVHLYEEYGEGMTSHLRGEFAFALHDTRRRVSYLVRDRLGLKPLFYTEARDSLVFASELKGLFAYPGLEPRLDRDQIFHMLGAVFLPGRSLFAGAQQVEPGCFLRIDDAGVHSVRYWHLPMSSEEDGDGRVDDRAVVEEFSRRFEESVRIRLHGDVDTAVYLSGGIDSEAVTRVVAHGGRRLKAFTVGFSVPEYDEAARAAEIAGAAGVEHHLARVGPSELAQPFIDSVWHAEAPVINAHVAAKFVLSRLASGHVKAVLTGEGADEMLAGYAQFHHQRVLDILRRRPHDPQARHELRRLIRDTGTLTGTIPIDRYPDEARVRRLFGAYPYPLAKTAYYQRRLWALLSTPLRRRARTLDSLVELSRHIDRDTIAALPAVAASQYLLFRTELPGYILSSLGDRVEMAHGLEGRTPFLDHELVEFVNRLPLRFKLRGDVDKWVLRQAVAQRFGAGPLRRKRAFMAPSLSTLGLDQRHGLLDRYLERTLIEEAGVFNPVAVRAARLGARLLPAGSRAQSVCEAATVMALSVHVLYELFCRDFRGSLERYRRVVVADSRDGAVAMVAAS